MGDIDDIRGMALPLEEESHLDPLLDRIGDARCVLLGAASYGDHEGTSWRAALTRRLVAERGFSFVAVEGDWADCWGVNRSVGMVPGAAWDPYRVLEGQRRWPSWLWANEEMARLCRWLRYNNAVRRIEQRVGFHGLDVYGLWESLRLIDDDLRAIGLRSWR